MLKAVLIFVVTLCLAVPFARGTTWQWAFLLIIPVPSYDADRIYRQIKGRVLDRSWALSALVGATMIASAMLVTTEYVALLLIGVGVILMITFWSVRAYRLFRRALSELCLPWPPPASQQT